MNPLWNKYKQDISICCTIISMMSGLTMLSLSIYKLKVPQCQTPSTIAEVREIQAENQDEFYLN